MLKTNKANFILALVMAIVLWAYVLGEVDPTRTITVRNIPIRLVNQTALESAGLVITEMDYSDISVTFSAKRSVANKIGKDDFHVTASLSDVTKGDNVIQLTLSKPSNITVENVSPEYINIKTEQQVSAEKDISIQLVNETDDNTEPKIIKLSDDKVKVSGAMSLVGQVSKVVADLDVTRIDEEPKTISVELRALDESEREVEGVELDFNNVSITAVMESTKTVPLVVHITGQDAGSVNRQIVVPDVVTIKGDDEILDTIENITCSAVDLSEIYESGEINLLPILPKGAELALDSTDLTGEVTVYNAGVAEFHFDENAINITGVDEGQTVKIHDADITVTAKGMSTVVNSITEEDFTLSADATGLESGTHTINLLIQTEMMGVDIIEASPNMITIDVEVEDEMLNGGL